ncbi:MAG TPA: ATP-binding protein [Vicinamibacterales bacterium]
MFRRPVHLRSILALLVISTTVPLAIFAARVVWTSWQQQKTIIDRQNAEQARAVSVAVDQEIARTVAALNVLAVLEPIDQPDRTHFSEIASRMIPIHPGWEAVRLVDPNLNVLADTHSTPEHPGAVLSPDWIRAVFDGKAFAVSVVRQDPTTRRWLFSVGVPVWREGRIKYALGARIFASSLTDVLARQKLPQGGVVTILDANQRIMARSRNEDKYVGGLPSPDLMSAIQTGPEGAARTRFLEGPQAYSAWSRSAMTGWTIGLGFPAEQVDRPIMRSFIAISLAGVGVLAVGILLALWIGRRIIRGQQAAATAARALARGEASPIFRSHIAEVNELSRALRDAASILEQRLHERDEAQREADRHRTTMLEREQAARQAAESLSRAKDEFVATVSHELRTPLNAIFGWVALLKSGSLDAERQAHAITVIDRNTRAQAQLIEDLLDMSRVIRGNVRLELRPVELGAILDATVDSLRPTAEARHITIDVHDHREPAVVSGDHSRLQQVLWNLLANSLKFTPSGGRIDVTLAFDGEAAVVRIADTGEGIAPEFLPHVFDRFRQETADVTRAHSGLGIGLSLVRYLTELHGGTVSAESGGKGLGSTFTVRLPLVGTRAAQAAAVAPPPLPAPGDPVLQGLHILAVDDDPDARDLISTALRQAGARVTAAGNVSEALGTLMTEMVDLVVSDIAMPNGSGYDLVRTIRERPRTAGLPAVAITAYNRPEDRERALSEGFDAHVGKPFEPRALVGLIAGLARPV